MKLCYLKILLLISTHMYSQAYREIDTIKNVNNHDLDTIIKHEDRRLELIMEKKISILFNKFLSINQDQGLEVYCIQIYNGNSRKEAIDKKNQFIRLFPDINPISYKRVNPNWKVLVGQFRTKIQAERYESEIKKYFRNCFVSKMILKNL